MRREVLDAMHVRLQRDLAVTDVAVCLHDDADECRCRKPKPGMLLRLAGCWNVALNKSVMIGDSWRDVEAGRAAGCTTILIDGPARSEATADYRVSSLTEAADVAVTHLLYQGLG